MDTPAQGPDPSKLLAMVDNVGVRKQVYKRARRTNQENRECGRLLKSIDELQETAEKFRTSGKAGQP